MKAFLLLVTLVAGTDGLAKTLVDPVNKNSEAVAIKGYDPVAYFKQNQPVKGSAQFSYQWMGATWWFANNEDRDMFAATPEKYAPQFGGYCAWAVSQGQTANIDPQAWKIVGGRLYLNYSVGVQRKWEQNVNKNIEAAQQNWPALHK